MTPQEFINYLIPLTKQNTVLQSLLIAQICLESGYGKKAFHNNYLGIKWHKGVDYLEGKTKEFVDGHYIDVVCRFAVYSDISDCIRDYLNILNRKRYTPVRLSKDHIEATEQIRLCGYATSPTYTKNLRKIIEQYKLYELDKMDTYLTPNFKLSEFKCKDGTPVPDYMIDNIKLVAVELQKVRDYYGKPIKINSGYRTAEYNKKVGGSPTSYHLIGLAADIKPLWDIPINEFYKVVKKLTNFKGYGIGTTFLHVDLRDKFTVWNY